MTRTNAIAAGLVFAATALLAPANALAVSFYLESNIFPSYSASDADSNTSGSFTKLGGTFSGLPLNMKSGFEYDLRNTAGFKFWNSLLVGFTYNYLHNPQNADAGVDNYSYNELLKKYEYGPAIGFVGQNFRLVFSYFFWGNESYSLSEYDTSGTLQSGESLTNHLRNGYQFVVGYGFNITPNIQLGPSLIYRHVAYKSQDSSNPGTPTDPNTNYTNRSFTQDAVESNLTPMISLVLQF